VIGDNGQPVLSYKKPNAGRSSPVATPVESDEFNGSELGGQWQWQANPMPGWALPAPALGALRLYTIAMPEPARNLWDAPNILLQKFPAPEFEVTAKRSFHAMADTDATGLIVMGSDYAYVSVRRQSGGLYVSQSVCQRADAGGKEREIAPQRVAAQPLLFRVSVGPDAVCRFSYSADGANYQPVGEPFQAKKGRWIGAKVGLFAVRCGPGGENGYADYDWFRVAAAR
jgi:beta-xylosidase